MTEMNDNLKYITEAISKTNLDDTDAIVETMTDPVYLEKLNNLIDEQVMSAESNNTALAAFGNWGEKQAWHCK